MRKSVIAAGVLGAALLAGAGLMEWPSPRGDATSQETISTRDVLFSSAHAKTPSTARSEKLTMPLEEAIVPKSATLGVSAPKISAKAPNGGQTAILASVVALTSQSRSAPHFSPLAAPAPRTLDVSVARGDTLMRLLVRNNVSRQEAHAVVSALTPVYDLRRVRIGQTFSLIMSPASAALPGSVETGRADDIAVKDAAPALLSLSFRPSVDQDIVVRRDTSADFKAEVIERPLERHDAHAQGRITTSLYDSAIAADLPIDVLMQLIQVFSFDVDFQREIQPGDSFAALYDEFWDEQGEPVRAGQIHWASMTLSGQTLEYAQFKSKSGFNDYYNRKGQSVKKTLMRTPINGARLSSRFGKRRHPVLGYTKIHRGVDFAAAKGVPIMAAGDGVIEALGRNGSYGKYIRIRHNSTYKTAYAHMSGYGRGLKKGSRVRQGNVIGYVGSTGRSTGPHLHYEVLKNGRQTNPMSVRLPAGDKLKGKTLKTFLAGWPRIDKRVALARGGRDVASD
ncbi:MAG: peptidoglycan DD-metalloendopeptidase family protein [Alphaproteobacteria bacterium]|nr:peptidoglycan DD-metalloendopeptidase family protein [Alphaproteobacteria bacterium]